MNKYCVRIPVYACVVVEVDAESEEKAIDIAFNNANTTLCYQCAGHIEISDFSEDGAVADLIN